MNWSYTAVWKVIIFITFCSSQSHLFFKSESPFLRQICSLLQYSLYYCLWLVWGHKPSVIWWSKTLYQCSPVVLLDAVWVAVLMTMLFAVVMESTAVLLGLSVTMKLMSALVLIMLMVLEYSIASSLQQRSEILIIDKYHHLQSELNSSSSSIFW